MVEKVTKGQLQPAAAQVAEQAVPTAKEFTEGQLQPAAKAVAEKVRSLFTAPACFESPSDGNVSRVTCHQWGVHNQMVCHQSCSEA